MNVVYLASGFPSPENPSHGIFNKIAVESLAELHDLTVVQYRLYKPGRKIYTENETELYKHIVLCIPFVPVMQSKLYWINHRIFRRYTRKHLSGLLNEADVVHASDGNLSVMIHELKSKYNFRLLCQFIGGDINQDIPPHKDRLEKSAWLQNIDAITVNSVSLKDRFHQLFGTSHEPKPIYRGVDLSRFIPGNGTNEDHTKFYYLGGLPDYKTFSHGRNTKGGLTLMQAWSMLDAEGKPKAKLMFAGPDSEIAMAREWRNSLSFPELVELVGKVNPEDIPEFHRNGDVCLVPSLEEGLPNVAMEAGASGKPVIGTEVGGIPEVILSDQTGILVKPGNVEALCESMRLLADNKGLVKQMGDKARGRMESSFDRKKFRTSYTEVYDSIIQ